MEYENGGLDIGGAGGEDAGAFPPDTGARGGTAPPFWGEVIEWVEQLTFAMLLVVLLFTFVCRTVTVDGPSMNPNLQNGDGLIVTRLTGDPSPGDIVAVTKLESINKPLIKRVIAVGGQTVDIDSETGDVLIDGEVLDEPYIAEKILPNDYYGEIFPLTVPEGSVFVMGDNRNHSWDSRAVELGAIDNRHVLGEVVWRYFPFSRFGQP